MEKVREKFTNRKIAYLGPEGTFTYQAAIEYFGKDTNKFIPVSKIKDIFSVIYTHQAEFGVVPAENSTGGVIADTLDLFVNTRLKVYDEIRINIHQTLMSNVPKEQIKRIYSHPQSFLQCTEYIENNFPGAELVESNSNTEGCLAALHDKEGACIGPEICGKLYGINILERNINDLKDNITRFFIVTNYSRNLFFEKSIVLLSVSNKPGSLYNILKIFKDFKCNMTHIASRPSKIKNWDYIFIIEFENLKDDKKTKKMIEKLKIHTDFFDYLGSY